eukprot:scaffold7337_cov131-Cylindrotheca_fusiformis.AAC.1
MEWHNFELQPLRMRVDQGIMPRKICLLPLSSGPFCEISRNVDGFEVHFELSKVLNTMKLVQRMVVGATLYSRFAFCTSPEADIASSQSRNVASDPP